MQPSHHTHPITLSPEAQAIPGKPRFEKQTGEGLRLAPKVMTVFFTPKLCGLFFLHLLQIFPAWGNLVFIKHQLHNFAAVAGR